MSNTLGIDFAADLQEQATDGGNTITIGSTSGILAIVGPETREFYAEDDPMERVQMLEREIQVALADLPNDALPARYTRVTTGGVNYAVVDSTLEPDQTTCRIRIQRRDGIDNASREG